MTTDEERHALVTPMIQQRKDPTVPQDVDHRSPGRARRRHVLPPVHPIAPRRREQTHQTCDDGRHERLGAPEFHAALPPPPPAPPPSPRAATPSAAPGRPTPCRPGGGPP